MNLGFTQLYAGTESPKYGEFPIIMRETKPSHFNGHNSDFKKSLECLYQIYSVNCSILCFLRKSEFWGPNIGAGIKSNKSNESQAQDSQRPQQNLMRIFSSQASD